MVLKMTPPVFIPRSETEELVQLMLQQCDDTITMRFMEIGCGSGAISLALLNALPKVIVIDFFFSIENIDLTWYFFSSLRHKVLPSIKVKWPVI